MKLTRGSAEAARLAHNQEHAGSTPAPAISGQQRDVIIEFIERWVDRFARVEWHDTVDPIDLQEFQAVESLRDLSWLTDGDADSWRISDRLDISALAAPLNQSILVNNLEDERNGWSFVRFRQVADLRELRGRPVMVARRPLVEMYFAAVTQPSINYQGSAERQYAIQIGDQWQSAFHGRRSTRMKGSGGDHFKQDMLFDTGFMSGRWTGHIQIGIGLQFRNEFLWRVAIGAEGGPTLAIPTDAIGVSEFLKLRERPAGKSRRAALVHWVEQHWRQLRRDVALETMVRRHLRGARRFNWYGLSGEILVARQSLTLEHLAAAERRDLRAAGADRRPKTDQEQRRRERTLLRAQHKHELSRLYLWAQEEARLISTKPEIDRSPWWRRLWNGTRRLFHVA